MTGMTTTRRPAFVGPHEGKELQLMLDGHKPMAMFVEEVDSEFEIFSEEDFDRHATIHGWVKRTRVEYDGAVEVRRILYALPGEEWRLDALMLTIDIYETLLPGRRPDLERIIGTLLGYNRSDIENYLQWLDERK